MRVTTSMIRTYSELQKFLRFKDRYNYLRFKNVVGKATFGYDRYLNQMLYKSRRWHQTRDKIIIRDEGCDLGIDGYIIQGKIIIHHMNPISIEDIKFGNDDVFDPNFLICTTERTHLAIHYGDESLLPKDPIIRRPRDTTLWR